MKHNTRKRFTGLLCVILALCMVTGVLAFFTDRVTAPAEELVMVEKGVSIIPEPDPEVEPDDPDKPNPDPNPADPTNPDTPPYVDPTPNNPEDDLTNLWLYSNAVAKVNYNPGDRMDLSYYLTNNGDLPVKTRETFVITCDEDMTESDLEFELFTETKHSDEPAYEDAWEGSKLEKLVKSKTSANSTKQYKYTTPEADYDSVAVDESVQKNYYVVFNAKANNDWQGVGITIDYTVEALQANGEWEEAVSAKVNLGGTEYDAVPPFTAQ